MAATGPGGQQSQAERKEKQKNEDEYKVKARRSQRMKGRVVQKGYWATRGEGKEKERKLVGN